MTPLGQTAHQTVNFSHKGGVGEVREDLQLTTIESSAIKPATQMKICLIAYHKFVRQVWIFGQHSVKLTTKLQAYLFVTQRKHNLQFVWEKI
jgi:hypothetical protein